MSSRDASDSSLPLSDEAVAFQWLTEAIRQPEGDPPAIPPVSSETAMRVAEFHRFEGCAINAWRTRCQLDGLAEPDTLKPAARDLAMATLAWSKLLGELIDTLSEANVHAIPIKGPVLVDMARSDGSLRRFWDLDLLIPIETIDDARAALARLGFEDELPIRLDLMRLWHRIDYEWSMVRASDGVRLELHFRLFQQYISPGMPMQDVFARSTHVELAGRTWPVLSPEDNILFLCVHGGKHTWDRLRLVADLRGVLKHGPPVDVERLVAMADDLGFRRFLAIGMWVADQYDPLPDGELARLATSDTVAVELGREFIAAWPTCTGGPRDRDLYGTLAKCRERRRDRWRMYGLIAVQSTPPDWEWLRLPPVLHWAYPLVRLARLALRQ